MNNIKESCIGCKIIHTIDKENLTIQAAVGASINRYGVTSLSCISDFLEILAKEQEWFNYPPVHRLLIDAYAIQHPPHLEHQLKLKIEQRLINASIQSIYIHLLALYCAIEIKMELKSIPKVMDHVLKNLVKQNIVLKELKSPDNLGNIKANDVLTKLENKLTIEEYNQLMWNWAKEAYNAWQDSHKVIKQLYEKHSK